MISKIYKVKDHIVVNLPFEIISKLGLKEGDEIDFLPYMDRYFIVAKKSDIVALITRPEWSAKAPPQQAAQQKPTPLPTISPDELAVLRKLDSVKYGDRTKDRLKQILNADERRVLQGLIKKKYVNPFKKPNEQHYKYGIAKSVYNAFLFGSRTKTPAGQLPALERQPQQMQQPQQAQKSWKDSAQVPRAVQPSQKKWEKELVQSQGYVELLESNGFLVVQTEAEAGNISSALEESIRRGLVVGTRAFNKKYYIVMKAFVSKNSQKVMKAIGTKKASVEAIAKETEIDEEGVRAILYMLAEAGDVIEVSRDAFKLV